MEIDLKLEVMGREVIKPATHSPHDNLQLSLLDLSVPAMYVSTIFLYKSEDLVTTASPEIISKKLKTSLSETLSRFHPLAGEIEGVSIKCNDKGAVYTEARTHLLLHEFLKSLNVDSLEELRPKIEAGDSPTVWPLLSVNVTFFGSGSGVSVSVCVSHRICDASSLLTLVTDWAATMTNKKSNVNTHQFAEVTIYPPAPHNMASPSQATDPKKCITNRFVFESSKIAELKRKAASQSVPMPTRVEAITSLIWKCARNASRANLVAPRSTLMYQAVDLRLRLPSNVLSKDAIGNLQTAFFLKNDSESKLEMHESVAAFRTAKERVNKILADNLQGNTLGQGLLNMMGSFASEFKPDVDIYTMSSWCGKPFYEVDFGWGSPVWTGSASHTVYDNMVYVVLMDSKDGKGVEAWISLPAEDMSVFVHDQELLAFAFLNPPVMI